MPLAAVDRASWIETEPTWSEYSTRLSSASLSITYLMLCRAITISQADAMASIRLLQCPNLLAEVFSHLEAPARFRDAEGTRTIENDRKCHECRRTLAAAALSCRAFTDHAQAVLWRRLDSMQPLLSLLSHPHPEFSDAPVTASTFYAFLL